MMWERVFVKSFNNYIYLGTFLITKKYTVTNRHSSCSHEVYSLREEMDFK